jgi:hypothetical protein
MRAHEEKLKSAKVILDETAKICDEAFQTAHGGIGKCVSQLITVVGLLLSHQEGLSSSVIDSCKVMENKNSVQPTGSQGPHPGTSNATKKQPTPDEIKGKRVKQAINKAEKSSILYELNLGPVPIINKETLTRKVTLALHENAGRGDQVSEGSITPGDAEEMIDDMLTCASLDFLGNGSSKFKNDKNPSDPRIGKMCTLPVKLIFKGKDERMRAEQTLRRVCNVRCTTPYPKKLRAMIREMIDEGKEKQPGHFVRVRVHPESLKMDAFASVDGKWLDLKIEREIPLDVLDNAEISAVEAEGEMETNIS